MDKKFWDNLAQEEDGGLKFWCKYAECPHANSIFMQKYKDYWLVPYFWHYCPCFEKCIDISICDEEDLNFLKLHNKKLYKKALPKVIAKIL